MVDPLGSKDASTFKGRDMIRKSSVLLAMAVATLIAGHAAAETDAVKERQELMKATGKSVKTVVQMIKGEVAYDAAKAKEAMETVSGVPTKFAKLFPEGSDMHPKTAAKPEIWDNWEDFKKRLSDLEAKSAAAAKAAEGGLDRFKAAFGQVGKACKGCHEKYKFDKN